MSAAIAALATGGLVSIAHAEPLTTEQRLSVINLLQSYNADADVVAKVRVAIGDTSAEPSAQKCYTFAANVRQGSTGAAISALQAALAKDGAAVSVTGVYDVQTSQAVTAFQEKYAPDILNPIGLARGTGYVGASTRVQLNKMFGCASGGATESRPQFPTCGQPPFTCNAPKGAMCSMIMPGPKTYNDYATYQKERATFLYNGACRTDLPLKPM